MSCCGSAPASPSSEAQAAPPAGRLLVDSDADVEYMKLALEVAAVAYREGELPVGCVYADAYTGEVVTAAANRTNASYNATTHAELVGINSLLHGAPDPAAASKIFRRCVLYVTLEPCIMCASAVSRAGVLRVVFGAGNDKFGGCGSVLCLNQRQGLAADSCYHPFSTRGGVLKGQAVELLRRFYCQRNVRAPKPHRRRLRGKGPPPLPPGDVASLPVSAAAAAASSGVPRGTKRDRAGAAAAESGEGEGEEQGLAPSSLLVAARPVCAALPGGREACTVGTTPPQQPPSLPPLMVPNASQS